MNIVKLGTCFAAAAITLGSASFLAQPAAAATVSAPCSSYEQGYADGWADGYCGGDGTITSCESNGDGTITVSGYCS